jgi:hypothetical protein
MSAAMTTETVVRAPPAAATSLAPLFADDAADEFRSRWDVVQRGFVDDPAEAVCAADELVAQVIKSLAESFSNQTLDGDPTDQASTENLRLALQRYRSFFERLLAI